MVLIVRYPIHHTINQFSVRRPDRYTPRIMSELPIADWQGLAASKRESNLKKIPEDWRLPDSLTSQFTETATISVLDVPATCGLLTPTELELTSNYDASKWTFLIHGTWQLRI